jgi:acyl-CoA hydrolase
VAGPRHEYDAMSVRELYRSRIAQPHDAVRRLVRDGDQIVVPTSAGEPPALLTALSECRRQLSNVSVAQMLAGRSYEYLDPRTVDHVRHVSMFFGPASRPAAGKGGSTSFRPIFPRRPG